MTTLDLTKGYYQVPVCKQDQEKTAFVTIYGKYEFKTIPFGLKGAPTTFQRLMDITLTDMSEFAAAYLEDVVIFSDTRTKHLEHIRKVPDRLMELGLTVKKCKCQWAQGTCTYLGHVVGRGKVQPEICKVEAVKDFRRPQTKRRQSIFGARWVL